RNDGEGDWRGALVFRISYCVFGTDPPTPFGVGGLNMVVVRVISG
ncbi:unnamed protein product, partial [marine sediment metagenome]